MPRGSPITIRGDVPYRCRAGGEAPKASNKKEPPGVESGDGSRPERRSLMDECKAGRLRSQLPEGRKVGRMVRPEWVDEWIEEGTHGIEAA